MKVSKKYIKRFKALDKKVNKFKKKIHKMAEEASEEFASEAELIWAEIYDEYGVNPDMNYAINKETRQLEARLARNSSLEELFSHLKQLET